MTAQTEALDGQHVVTEPGVYDMPSAAYHLDPVPGGSLSSTGARKLLWPSTPAQYRYDQDHPETSDALDFGAAAHKVVLADGEEDLIVVVDAPDWRTKDAQRQRIEARAAGVPVILTKHRDQVHAMADAIRAHPLASALMRPTGGKVEQSAFWRDPVTGTWCRCRYDFLPDGVDEHGYLLLADYKTAMSAEPEAFGKAAATHGYYQQAAFYTWGADVLGLAERIAFMFVVQEKTPPYLVNVIELDGEAHMYGEIRNRLAIDVYRRCVETDTWPGYSDQVQMASLPGYFVNALEVHHAEHLPEDHDPELRLA